jgi:hypothetical protein
MGNAQTCEYSDPRGTGDVEQITSAGLAFWRKSANTPTFTNGSEHWANTPAGWVSWTGDSIDPPPDALPFTPDQDLPLVSRVDGLTPEAGEPASHLRAQTVPL